MGLMTDQWIIKGNKTEHLQFRQGAITKIKSTTNKSKTVQSRSPINQNESPKFNEKNIEDIDKIIAELEELEELRHLPFEEQVKRLEEAEENEQDLDSDELLKKRRLEESKTHESKYSVLDYHIGSVSGDKLMQKIKGNYKISEDGDKLMKNLGASD